jgi:hypothetical protein
VRNSLPSSSSIITATLVIGFVIEATRKIVSTCIALRLSMSWNPLA